MTADADIPRNKELYSYLQEVTTLKIPWLEKSFETKLGGRNRDQVLTEIFDYIRCANLVETSKTATGGLTVGTRRSSGHRIQMVSRNSRKKCPSAIPGR